MEKSKGVKSEQRRAAGGGRGRELRMQIKQRKGRLKWEKSAKTWDELDEEVTKVFSQAEEKSIVFDLQILLFYHHLFLLFPFLIFIFLGGKVKIRQVNIKKPGSEFRRMTAEDTSRRRRCNPSNACVLIRDERFFFSQVKSISPDF